MKWLGLTGGIATGKSTVSRLLLGLGVSVIDADRIARQVMEKGSDGHDQVVKEFGVEVLDSAGEVDRRKLGHIVFNDPTKRKKLESIIHPLVQAEVQAQRQWLQDQGLEIAVYDVPLLFEKALQSQFDAVILVTSDPVTQRARMKTRDNHSEQEITQRLAAQIPIVDKEKLATHIIRNDGTLEDLEKQVKDLLAKISND